MELPLAYPYNENAMLNNAKQEQPYNASAMRNPARNPIVHRSAPSPFSGRLLLTKSCDHHNVAKSHLAKPPRPRS